MSDAVFEVAILHEPTGEVRRFLCGYRAMLSTAGSPLSVTATADLRTASFNALRSASGSPSAVQLSYVGREAVHSLGHWRTLTRDENAALGKP